MTAGLDATPHAAEPDEPAPGEIPGQAGETTGEEAPPTPPMEVEVKLDGGTLDIRRGQGMRDLSPRQRAAFRAIVSFEPSDPTSWPHIEVFLEVCAKRGLDPWAKEAYLIKRKGADGKDTYTIQTSIEGYRKLANDSGRYHSAAKIYWMGSDDDPNSWTITEDEMGTKIRVPLWLAAWPWPDRNPAAVRAVIRHRDEYGELVFSEAIAHWGMFAPYSVEWEGSGSSRHRKVDPATGKPVMKLAAMWSKDGGAHQLGKCGEAQVLRKAFPAQTSGILVDEEMHQADARAAQVTATDARAAAFERARTAQERARTGVHDSDAVHAQPDVHAQPEPDVHAQPDTEEIQDADIVEDEPASTDPEAAPPDDGPSDDDLRAWLIAEVAEIAEVIGRPVAEMTASLEHRLQSPLGEASPAALVGVIGLFRGTVVDALRAQGRDGEADAYADAGTSIIAPPEELFGRVQPGCG